MIKKILIIVMLLVEFSFAKAQTVNIDSSEQGRLTAFRKLFRDSLPTPLGYTNDYEGIFSDKQEAVLDSLIADFEKRSKIQLAIVTLDTFMVAMQDFESLLTHIHNKWGVGDKETNRGIVIGLATKYRAIRISNSYGIQNILSDAETKTIIDDAFIPYFRERKYYDGVVSGLKALFHKLEGK